MKMFLRVIKNGILGYAIFFSSLLAAKFIAYVFGISFFGVATPDLEICLIGFFLAALIQVVEIIKQRKEEQTNLKARKNSLTF